MGFSNFLAPDPISAAETTAVSTTGEGESPKLVGYYNIFNIVFFDPIKEEIIFRGCLFYVLYHRSVSASECFPHRHHSKVEVCRVCVCVWQVAQSGLLHIDRQRPLRAVPPHQPLQRPILLRLCPPTGTPHSPAVRTRTVVLHLTPRIARVRVAQVALGVEIGLFYSGRFLLLGSMWEPIVLHVANNVIAMCIPIKDATTFSHPLVIISRTSLHSLLHHQRRRLAHHMASRVNGVWTQWLTL
jgi:hypothetical protein